MSVGINYLSQADGLGCVNRPFRPGWFSGLKDPFS